MTTISIDTPTAASLVTYITISEFNEMYDFVVALYLYILSLLMRVMSTPEAPMPWCPIMHVTKHVVIGRGYFGVPVATRFTESGFKVTVIDIVSEKVDKTIKGLFPIGAAKDKARLPKHNVNLDAADSQQLFLPNSIGHTVGFIQTLYKDSTKP
ncbi:MAG: hypothetical protein ACFFCP_16475 [Promethearchaeota archaeon]